MHTRFRRIVAAAALWLAAAAAGLGAAAADGAAAELHALLVRQVELSVAVSEGQRQLDGCVGDPSLTSPEIEALRRQLGDMRNELAAAAARADGRAEEMRQAMVRTQALLRVTIEALPAVREKIERIETGRRELLETGRRIRELREAAAR